MGLRIERLYVAKYKAHWERNGKCKTVFQPGKEKLDSSNFENGCTVYMLVYLKLIAKVSVLEDVALLVH